jgi:hypothetical protein
MQLIRSNHIKRLLLNCRYVLTLLLSVALLAGCKKNTFTPDTASLLIYNAVPGSAPLLPDFTNGGAQLFKYTKGIVYGTYNNTNNFFSSYTGEQRLRLYPMPDTTSKDQPLFDMSLNLLKGSISTLFLTGTPDAPDTVLIRENLPYLKGEDSAMAFRFIHLSPGSASISVNLQGQAPGELTGSLDYKQVTDFKQYPVSNKSNYVIEFREAISGNLLLSYKFLGEGVNYRYLNRCFTIVFGGLPGGAGNTAIKAFTLPHSFWQ